MFDLRAELAKALLKKDRFLADSPTNWSNTYSYKNDYLYIEMDQAFLNILEEVNPILDGNYTNLLASVIKLGEMISEGLLSESDEPEEPEEIVDEVDEEDVPHTSYHIEQGLDSLPTGYKLVVPQVSKPNEQIVIVHKSEIPCVADSIDNLTGAADL